MHPDDEALRTLYHHQYRLIFLCPFCEHDEVPYHLFCVQLADEDPTHMPIGEWIRDIETHLGDRHAIEIREGHDDDA